MASNLIYSFRSTRQHFTSDYKKKFTGMVRRRQGHRKKGKDKEADLEDEADEMATRLQRSLIDDDEDEVEETSFRGKDFDEWVTFILQVRFARLLSFPCGTPGSNPASVLMTVLLPTHED